MLTCKEATHCYLTAFQKANYNNATLKMNKMANLVGMISAADPGD